MLSTLSKSVKDASVLRKLEFAANFYPRSTPNYWDNLAYFCASQKEDKHNVTADLARQLVDNLKVLDKEAFCLDLELTKEIIMMKRQGSDIPLGSCTHFNQQKCCMCESKLHIRSDRPSTITIYSDTLGTLPGTHYTKYQAHITQSTRHTLHKVPGTHYTKYQAHITQSTRHTLHKVPGTHYTKYQAHITQSTRHTLHKVPGTHYTKYQAHITQSTRHTLHKVPGTHYTKYQAHITQSTRHTLHKVPGTHYTKYCRRKGCSFQQHYGYYTLGQSSEIRYDKDWEMQEYFLATREAAISTINMLRRFDKEVLIGQLSYKQRADIYNDVQSYCGIERYIYL